MAQPKQDGANSDAGVWFMALAQGPVSDSDTQLRWWLDAQLRFLDDSDGYDQTLFRPGIGYAISKGTTVWLGYAFIHSHPSVGGDFGEHRVWQQVLWSTLLNQGTIQSRTRLEQRFLKTGSQTGWRLRQFVKLAYPLLQERRLGLALYDEVFFDLNDTDWGANSGFVQNRLFMGLSWKLDGEGRATLELGYLSQLIRNEGRTDRLNHIVSMNLILNFD